MPVLTPFERDVIAKFLSGNHPALPALREQLAHCTVANRKMGDGYYVAQLEIDSGIPAAQPEGRFILSGIHADPVPGLERGFAFSLYIDEGRLRELDAVTFGEPWPPGWQDLPNAPLTYIQAPTLLDNYPSRAGSD